MSRQNQFGEASGAVWMPRETDLDRSRLYAAIKRWGFGSLDELHQGSVARPEWFWPAVVDDLGIEFSRPFDRVVDHSRGKEFPQWFVGGRINIAGTCVQRHANSTYADKAAVVHEGDNGRRRTLTHRELADAVERFAGNLRELGIRRGDRVALFLPVVPEAVVAFMACAKIGAVLVPAFTGYGPDALATRLVDSEAVALITADGTTRRGSFVGLKAVADAAAQSAPQLRTMVVVRCAGKDVPLVPGRDVWYHDLNPAPTPVATEEMDAHDPLAIIYTSGTTGRPKGIVHSHAGFLVKCALDFGYNFDIQHDDVIAWIADLGWALGPLLIVGGLHFGATIVLVEGLPDHPEPDRLWRIVERHGVTFQGIVPSAARRIRSLGEAAKPVSDLGTLRAFASTGEPWDEQSWRWLFDDIGRSQLPILNYCGGTEVSGGILAGYTILPHGVGNLAGPILGLDVGVLDDDGTPAGRGHVGELTIHNTFPGMTHSFWRDDDRYLDTYWSRWPGVWVHGDLASRDADGYWSVRGRSDDTIKIGGRRVGPAEIEDSLLAQEAVAEAAVIGVPDPMLGHRIAAFVVARPGVVIEPAELLGELSQHIGKSLLPSTLHVVAALPKTKNGKILRRAIRAQYLGEPPGDLSSLDPQTPLHNIPAAAPSEPVIR